MEYNGSHLKVCVVNVTYGDRWYLVEQVMEAIKNQSTDVS